MVTAIASIVIALFAITTLYVASENILDSSSGSKTNQEIKKLAAEVNRTCDDGVDTDFSLELSQLQVKLDDDEIFIKDREEDDTEYDIAADVSCPYKGSELVIPSSEEKANAMGFYILNFEEHDNGYRKR